MPTPHDRPAGDGDGHQPAPDDGSHDRDRALHREDPPARRAGFTLAGAGGGGPGSRAWHTVGLACNYRHPELLVEGLSLGESWDILAPVASDVIEGWTSLEHGDVVLMGDVNLWAVVVTDGLLPGDTPSRLARAWDVEPRAIFDFGAIQLVWPDPDGCLPWEPDFSGDQPVRGPIPPWV